MEEKVILTRSAPYATREEAEAHMAKHIAAIAPHVYDYRVYEAVGGWCIARYVTVKERDKYMRRAKRLRG